MCIRDSSQHFCIVTKKMFLVASEDPVYMGSKYFEHNLIFVLHGYENKIMIYVVPLLLEQLACAVTYSFYFKVTLAFKMKIIYIPTIIDFLRQR